MIYGYFYRLLMRLSHRFNWHHMKPNQHLEHGKIYLWCHWCGARAVLIKPSDTLAVLRKAQEK
jgi:hypothetical protein